MEGSLALGLVKSGQGALRDWRPDSHQQDLAVLQRHRKLATWAYQCHHIARAVPPHLEHALARGLVLRNWCARPQPWCGCEEAAHMLPDTFWRQENARPFLRTRTARVTGRGGGGPLTTCQACLMVRRRAMAMTGTWPHGNSRRIRTWFAKGFCQSHAAAWPWLRRQALMHVV